MLKYKRLTNDFKRVIMKVQFKGGNVMKKLFKFLVIVFMFVILLGTIEVNAAKITIVKDENPDRVNVLSLNDDNYFIVIDEQNNLCYVLLKLDIDNDEIVGTCKIIMVDELGMISEFGCIENSLGEITITLIDSNEGYISQLTGEMSNYFDVNNYIIID